MQGEEEEPTKTLAGKRKNRKDAICSSCGLIGHCTNRSKACANFVAKKARRAAEATAAAVADCNAPDPVEDMRRLSTRL
jgi:ApbE superfamily uncharacterized protein (UPF0280 family)